MGNRFIKRLAIRDTRMGKLLLTLFAILFFLFSGQAQTTITGGSVKGKWTKANSPYRITGNINIDAGDTLKIEPGVKVEFSDKVGVYVRGSLKANGAVGDSIDFTVAPITNYHNLWETTSYGWRGFVFLGDLPDSDTTEFSFCKFSYVNKTDSTGCMFLGFAKGYQSDSTRFITDGLGAICFSHRILRIESSSFKNLRGPGAAVVVYRGGLNLENSTFGNIKCENPNGIPALAASAIVIDDKEIFPNPTKFYSHNIMDINGVDLYRGCFSINARKKVTMSKATFSRIHALEIINTRAVYLGAVVSDIDIDSISCSEINDSTQYGNRGSFLGLRGNQTNISNVLFKNIMIERVNRLNSGRKFTLLNIFSTKPCVIDNVTSHNYERIFRAGIIPEDRLESFVLTVERSPDLKISNVSINNSSSGIRTEIFTGNVEVTNTEVLNSDSTALAIGNKAFRGSNILLSNNGKFGLVVSAGDPGEYIDAFISNSIITGNQGGLAGKQISYSDGSKLTLKNCIIEQGPSKIHFNNLNNESYHSLDTINCITGVPDFVNPTAGAGRAFDASTADWHLKSNCLGTSIGFNQGTDTLANDGSLFGGPFALPTTDLEGNPRISCGTVDIGPYELQNYTQGVITGALLDSSSACPGDTLNSFLSTEICTSNASAYQWQVKEEGGSFSDIPDATSQSFTLNNIQQNWSKNNYRLKITNPTCAKVGYSTSSLLHVKAGPQFTLPSDTLLCDNEEIEVAAGASLVNPKWFDNNTDVTRTFKGSTNQTWGLSASSAEGCMGKDSFTITPKPAPEINLGNDTSLINNQSLELKVSGVYPQYLWEDNTSSIARTIQNDTQDLGDHLYWLEVTASNGCKDRDSIIITFKKTDDITQLKTLQIRLYPNPSTGQFKLQIPEEGRVSILSLSGKVVWTQDMPKGTWEVKQSNLPKGVYLLEWQTEQERSVQRLIIE